VLLFIENVYAKGLLVGRWSGEVRVLVLWYSFTGVDSQMTRTAMRKAAVRSSTSCIRTTHG